MTRVDPAKTVIEVGGQTGYRVVVGRDLKGELAGALAGAQRVAVIHPRALRETVVGLRDELTSNFEPLVIEVPDAEEQKTSEVAAHCWSLLGRAGFTRSDAIVGLGGGATTDLAGFVAATWLRGVGVVHVPTTLLGMVDAAIGGKTGINTAEGKNLVGVFHPPTAVVCDLAALDSLPRNDLIAGLAEVIKVGFTHDPQILELVEDDQAGATDPASPILRELVERAIQVKADVVGVDLRETVTGGREVLNYGHTLAHAIELAENYSWRHGAAVSVGLVFAAELARLTGRLPDAVADRHLAILESVGLPVSYRAGAWPELLAGMRVDKKKRGNVLRFILLEDLARPTFLDGPDPAVLAAAYAKVAQ